MAAPGFLDSISPWSSRSTTPKPPQSKGGDSSPQLNPLHPVHQQKKDHVISRLQRLSSQDYPLDCPKATIKWFYAVDVINTYPQYTSRLW